jgi:hypothetical protein
MSAYTGPVVPAGPVAPQSRPATLAAAVWLSLAVGVLSLISGIIMIAAGKSALRDFVLGTAKSTLGTDLPEDALNTVANAALDEAYRNVVLKASVAIAAAVVVLVFALLARSGATWARIVLAVALAGAVCGGSGLQIANREVLPSATVALAWLVPVLGIAAIVLLFLPATNQWAKQRGA